MRIVGESLDVYKYLEPLYLDYRKIRTQNKQGGTVISQSLAYPYLRTISVSGLQVFAATVCSINLSSINHQVL